MSRQGSISKKAALISFLMVLVLLSIPAPQARSISATPQAQIWPTCEAGCEIPVVIPERSKITPLPGGGHQVEVHWSLGKVPEGMKLINVAVNVSVRLDNNRVEYGEKFAKPDDK